MVFESLVSDLLNKFIGGYVENLDKSQLKIGIWGGNVVLENLRIKENALSDLDVPFKVKAGQIGKLTLKIPWKNLYGDAVLATLDGLYLLVVPGAIIKYDAEKEERYQLEAKQKELQRIEEALQMAAQREKRTEEKKDTFIEKLATQVIKNLQVKISSIHLRYEDDLLDPEHPVSMGLTLSELSLQTTDENWNLCFLNEAAKIIYKLCRLDCLCFYWNVNSPIFYKRSRQEILDLLMSGISTKDQELPQYQYIFKPIFASAKVRINPNAELDMTSPKANLHMEVQNIAIEMTKAQYLTMVEVLESVDCMVKNAPYRKFRPDVPVHRNAKLWWRYGFNCILEVHIRRLSRMWSWSNIKQHRENLKAYKSAYKSRLLTQSKTDGERHIQDLERVLDVFNITLGRQQAQMEVIRSGQKMGGKKTSGQKQGGFFSGWFGRKPKKEEQEESPESESPDLDQLMTPEEKEKLYSAIGYSGSSSNLALPPQYVAVVATFQLLKTSVTIREHQNVPEILKVQMINLSTKICQRPGAQAFRVEASLEHWYVTGLQQQGAVPSLIASVADSSSSLLHVIFELNPEDSGADQLLRIYSQPVEIIYDAVTVNTLADFFRTEKGLDLEVITSATLSKLEEIKDKTAAGLSHIIENRKVLDLVIDLKPSYLLVPKSGFYSNTSELIIVDFGNLQLHSVKQSGSSSSSFSSLEEIMDRAYERYIVELRRVQVLYSKSGEAWKSSRLQVTSTQHILQPMDFTLHLAKSMVEKDSRMPRFKVFGELPLLHVKISDQKIQNVLELIDGIPLPLMESRPTTPTEKVPLLADIRQRTTCIHPDLLDAMETDSDTSEPSTDDDLQLSTQQEVTNLHFKFEVREVLLELARQADQEKTVLSFRVCQLGAEGQMRSFDLSLTSYLRCVFLDYCDGPGGATNPLHLIRSSDQQNTNLLKVKFIKADPVGPTFETQFDNTEQTLKVEFSSLDFLLHTDALLSTINFLNAALPQLSAKSQETRKKVEKEGRSHAAASQVKEGYSFRMFAVLGSFHVEVCDDNRSIADIRVQGIDASVSVQQKQTDVFARLRDVVVTDAAATVHRKVVSIMGEELFSFSLTLCPGATEDDGYGDMSKVDGKLKLHLGCIRIVYVHKFLLSLLDSFSSQCPSADETFIDNFQTAKAAVSVATAQAAEKAASSVRDLAEKSFRLAMDISLNAPLIVIPQSSTSHNALLVDLGLITVGNHFELLPGDGSNLPAVLDKMEVKLTRLKLLRTVLTESSKPEDQILQPMDLELFVTRNLSSSWFPKVPGVQVQGVLRSLSICLGEEDLGLLMKILQENIGEVPRATVQGQVTTEKAEPAEQPRTEHGQVAAINGELDENIVNVLLDFEVNEMVVTLKRTKKQMDFLVLLLSNLGVNTKVRKSDMSASSYIKKVSLTCPEFKDSNGQPLCLVHSSGHSGSELLKVQYCRADRNGPAFSSTFQNTEQNINVTFASLDVMLHTEALLSAISFLSAASSSSAKTFPGAAPPRTDDRTHRPATQSSLASGDVIDLKVTMTMGAFNIHVCDRTSKMADINIRGFAGSLMVEGPQTHISARLQDIIILNVDPGTVHTKAVSIMGDEVFSFALSLTPTATEGSGYGDTSRSDGRVKLNVGCIRVVYLHKFVMSLLNFSNNFQTAQAALSAATAQAAEKAASSVRSLAQRSFRLAMDVKLKAPLIVIPQSSTSHEALVADLGLITVGNHFSLLPVEGCALPAVFENMLVQLTDLKLSRTSLEPGLERPASELLEPVNLHLDVKRNLSASWYTKAIALEVNGDLKPMKVELSQEDLKVLLRILVENLGEAGDLDSRAPRLEVSSQIRGVQALPTGESGKPVESSNVDEDETETVKFTFSFESLRLVLFNNSLTQNLKLGEFSLLQLRASGRILGAERLEVNAVLTSCTLDDLRTGVDRVSSRMIRRKDEESSEVMMDVTYRRGATQQEVVAVLQKLYVCASVEFLMAVADFFLQALPTGGRTLKQSTEPRVDVRATSGIRNRLRMVVLDPEVVFVANQEKADAPALTALFQCDFTLQEEENGVQNMRANLRELKVLASPFIRSEQSRNVTTVLKPCSVALETRKHPDQPLSGSVTVEEVIVKISPFIINTFLTITSAMVVKPQPTDQSQETRADANDLWSVRNIYDSNFWFLGVDQAMEMTESFREPDGRNQGESFTAEVKVIQVVLESGLGHQTVPLLLAESSLNGRAKNWSSFLQLQADMTLEVNYFNETHAVWEPLIERVDGGQRRWNLELEVKNNPATDKSPVPGDDFLFLPDPRTAISICSKDTMNITVSSSSLSVFQNLAKAFSEGTASTFDHTVKDKAPFTITNALGIPLMVQHSSNLRLVGSTALGKLHELATGESLRLDHAGFDLSSRGKLSALQRQESCLFHLSIVPTGFSEITGVAVDRPGRRLYNVRGPFLQEAVSVLLQIDAADGNKVVMVRAPLQIKNHFSVPFTVLKHCSKTRSLQPVGEVQPEKEFHVDLDTYRCQLFVRPAGPLEGQYGPSSTCISWKEQVHVSSEIRSLLQCPSADCTTLPLMVSTLAVPDDLQHIDRIGDEDWDPAYIIHLHPVATLRNLLPYTVRYMLENSADFYELEEGSTSDLLNARVSGEIMSLVLFRYQGREWNGHIRIDQNMPEFFPLCLACDSDAALTVDVSAHVTRTPGHLHMSLFSPYWIINKTLRVLQYRSDDVNIKHPAECRDIVLFSFKKKNMFSKSKLQLSVSTSSWSNDFSLDTVGSYGCVRCPANNADFLVGVSIQMSSFKLTRIVTMTPFYSLVNKTSYELEVGELTAQSSVRWHYISSTECVPLWPENHFGKFCVRVVGCESASKCFFFNRQDSGTLLSLDLCGGIIVDVNVSDHSTIITFSEYYEGAAPALLLNHTPWVTISYQQSGGAAIHELRPGEAKRFVWDDPAAPRKLSWNHLEHCGELDLLKDDVGQFSYDNKTQVHWVSFLDGRQRVLLFTEDVAVVTKARQAEELEQFQQEVKVSLQNLGLSLVNNSRRQEVAYIGITSSGVVWEMKRKNRWKAFSQKQIDILEEAYQNQQAGWMKLDTNLEVNFTAMKIRQPVSTLLRRNFLSGIQVEFKQSEHQRSLRAQLRWLQIDNQLPGAIFPIVFHPVPPPKSIALDSEPKPFIDMSVITRFNQHSNVLQIKYFMALIQEMAVKVDQGFLGSILALFSPPADFPADGQKSKLIEGDLQLLQAELTDASLSDTSGLSFFEHFHISPIKLHLSLSLGSGGDETDQDAAALQSLNLLLKSIGATLTDVDDIVFKLAFFEVKYQFYRREKLMWAVVRHYSEQFLKQMYVLVLGLDVLGNPFGLIRGLSEGVEAFFYEPFQGAVHGPEEFAEGLVIGVRSLFGHTVGGAAGMVSKITGSVGKGLAAITMDKEYQQKRREEMNRPPKDFGESLAKGGKGLLKGVVGGVTGIVTKPVEGAKKEGAAGFFKGIGRGLVGVVARPTGGIVDMASSTFQGIQRAAESTETVNKLRPPRLIQEDGIIRPYNPAKSQGLSFFQSSGIKQLDGEMFREHLLFPGHRKTNIIITNRRVMCVKQIDFVDHYNKEWECLFENFSRAPVVSGSELSIYYKDQQKLKLPRRDGQEFLRTIQLGDLNVATKLHASICEAQVAQRQHHMARQKSQRFLNIPKQP